MNVLSCLQREWNFDFPSDTGRGEGLGKSNSIKIKKEKMGRMLEPAFKRRIYCKDWEKKYQKINLDEAELRVLFKTYTFFMNV